MLEQLWEASIPDQHPSDAAGFQRPQLGSALGSVLSHFQSNVRRNEHAGEVQQEAPNHPAWGKTASGKPGRSLRAWGAWQGASELCSRSRGTQNLPATGTTLNEPSPKCFRTKQNRAWFSKLQTQKQINENFLFPQQPATLLRGNHCSQPGRGLARVLARVWHVYLTLGGLTALSWCPAFLLLGKMLCPTAAHNLPVLNYSLELHPECRLAEHTPPAGAPSCEHSHGVHP